MREVSCLLIRHGKTQGNIEDRYIGCRTDEELCSIGSAALNKSGICKVDRRFGTKVYVSPLRRCIQTANILFPSNEIIPVEDFREIDFGDFENMNYEELNGNQDYQKWIDSGGIIPFPGGEAREDFVKRSVDAFRGILLKETNEANLIPFVIHGGSIMAIMSELTGEDYYSFQIRCGEAYEVKCLVDEEKIDVISYNRIFNRSDS